MLDITQEHQPLAAFIQDFRHHLHRHPELSNDEFNTTASIRAVEVSNPRDRFVAQNWSGGRNWRHQSRRTGGATF